MASAFSNTKPQLNSSDYTERIKGVTRYAYLRSLSTETVPYSNYDGTVIMDNSKIISSRSYNELLNITKGSYMKPHKDCSLSIICPSYQSSGNLGENTYTDVSSEFIGEKRLYSYKDKCADSCELSGVNVDPSGKYSECNSNVFYHMKKKDELTIDASLANYDYHYNGFRFPAPVRLRTMKETNDADASCSC